ncbi:DNA repair protein RadC [Acetobacter musti]|uniref:DNA repair protein RadC n=1 Tax=Acetobacter musti TaxID=864732 RepID=A0ABX0JGT7_9PROT|nr:JAB domain-containing protein [Acetobacter musti]NHN83063.1 DNA repair protein RadC [Acetobacter musti]
MDAPHSPFPRLKNAEPSRFASTGPTGHRGRMRERVLSRGAAALADYELVEMLLFYGIPRRDTKPLAKSLINRFGSLASVLNASPAALRSAQLNDETITALKLPAVAACRLAEAEARQRPVLGNWDALLGYFDTALDGAVPGQLRILFLDNRNRLLGDEAVPTENTGAENTGEGARRGPRIEAAKILRRALSLHATALIAVRLCTTSGQGPARFAPGDEDLARELTRAGALLAVTLHDMIALQGGNWLSLKQQGKLPPKT